MESKRWGDGRKPKVVVGSTVAFGGFINRIARERNFDRTVSAIEVEVTTIAFLSTQAISHFNPSRNFPSLLFLLY